MSIGFPCPSLSASAPLPLAPLNALWAFREGYPLGYRGRGVGRERGIRVEERKSVADRFVKNRK